MSTDPADRLADVEIDSGLRHDDGTTRINLTLREADGLRRTLGAVVVTDAQFMRLSRGTPVTVPGSAPVEFEGGDALLDALDRLTSGDGKLSRRAPIEIAEMLLTVLNAGMTALGGQRAYVPFDGVTAIRRAMRSTTPRPTPEGQTR